MSSILTNAAAMTALKSLQATNKSLEMTQARISTGYRVGQASDNAAYWSIATTMRSDNKALLTVQDALGLGAAKIDIAYTGVSETIKVVDEIKAKLVAAREPGVDRSKIQAEISALQGQLLGNASTSSFAGENWLSVDSDSTDYNSSKSMVASFTRASDGTVSVSTITISTDSIKLFDAAAEVAPAGVGDVETGVGILDASYDEDTGQRITNTSISTFSVSTLDISALTNNAADLDILDNYIVGVDDAISRMTIAASDLGAAKKRVDLQVDFVSNLMDAIDRGVGSLVDANMNEESTRLQALQVQQQLGIQGLSIANASVQGILSLFQG
ncbi:flagellin [Aquibium sp. ELW1220]|uniref:flagellin N-terminal helical domain-containing protein n=1 Tax=Aquibium sp. ELW1220 TaxID=2976766 RepID=UPI0025B0C3D1|nr:flagellin [Aquibium sp. ELW1220]MDN2580845.1 flagellin [Aquibium sp. ELW1220]